MALHRTIAAALFGAVLSAAWIGSAAADKLDDIKARGKLLIGNSETSPPFSSRENGKVIGYDVDLAAQVAKRLGIGVEFVPIINSERIPALQQNRIDLAASGMTRADNRRHLIGFSLAYLVSPHTVIIRKDAGIKAVKQMAEKKAALGRRGSFRWCAAPASTRSSRRRCRAWRSCTTTPMRCASMRCATARSQASSP